MYSLTRVSSSVGVKPGYILPKPSLLMCAQFETFSKYRHTNQEHQQPRFDLNKTNKRPREDLSNCQHFYHPMGVKKSLFVDNENLRRYEEKEFKLSKPVLRPIHCQNLDMVFSPSKSPSRRASKIVIPRQLKLDTDVVKMSSKQAEEKKSPPKANLELISYQLTQDLTNIFMKRQEWRMYHPELVFVDNVRGVLSKIFSR